jgi:ubiquinone/menaquinone biosynthesis C-methylase UbiE
MQPNANLKNDVKNYWNTAACGTEFINQQKYSLAYFQAIEQFRYTVEPEIFGFAQFTRFHGKKILEVGVGAGTDFLQWVRAGTQAHGIDLTEEAVAHVTNRLAMYGLEAAEIRVGDAEKLPYADNNFDLVYSWGVIHHSPDTLTCLKEIIRVTKPGGTVKVMIYNRHSLFALYRYVLGALLKGKPFQSLKQVLYHQQESPGTKAYTFGEVKKMLAPLPVTCKQLKAPVTQHDLLYYKAKPFRWMAYLLACIFGWNRVGWFMMIELEKKISE